MATPDDLGDATRRSEVDSAIRRGEYAPPDDVALFGFVGAATVLGLASALIVVLS